MRGNFNRRPATYRPPQRGVERFVCSKLFRFILDDQTIGIDFGEATNTGQDTEPEFIVASPRLWPMIKLALIPDLWVGDSYAAGCWYLIKGDLADFLGVIQQKANRPYRLYFNFVSGLRGCRHYLGQYLINRYYTRKVKKHYEVDSKIYEAFLDDELLYTCAFFPKGDELLGAAQQVKLDAVIERLRLPAIQAEVLDIGCGWGGFTRSVARRHPSANVCGLSISNSQIEWAAAKDRVCLTPQQAARISYKLEDYIDHNRSDHYDAISVIGMIEHVGLGGYDEFFLKLYELLKLKGTVVIHTIVSPRSAIPSNAWIDRHIFTGGYAPSISELIGAVEKQPFQISAAHIYPSRHYRKTIECWLLNFHANIVPIEVYLRQKGYNDEEVARFIRIWIFYLSSVRNMFAENDAGSHQIVQLCLQKL